MSKVTVCKKFEIAYSHNLPHYEGKCRQVHGHTGIIEVELSGVRDAKVYPGMTVDFYDIKNHIGTVVEKLDHQNLNEVLNKTPGFLDYLNVHSQGAVGTDPMDNGASFIPPTSENIVWWLHMMIKRAWPDAEIRRIRFWESPSSFAEWKE